MSSPLNFFVTYVLPRWREALIVALAVACYALYHKEPRVVEREIERVREVAVEQDAEVVTRIVTRTVTLQPDGTRIETDATSVTQAETTTHVDIKEHSRPASAYDPPRYSVAVDYGTDRRYGAEFGMRLGNLPIWVDLGARMVYPVGEPSVHLGLRYEW